MSFIVHVTLLSENASSTSCKVLLFAAVLKTYQNFLFLNLSVNIMLSHVGIETWHFVSKISGVDIRFNILDKMIAKRYTFENQQTCILTTLLGPFLL